VNEDEAMIGTNVEPKLGNKKETQGTLSFKSYLPGGGVFSKFGGGKLCPNKALCFSSVREKCSCFLGMGQSERVKDGKGVLGHPIGWP